MTRILVGLKKICFGFVGGAYCGRCLLLWEERTRNVDGEKRQQLKFQVSKSQLI